MKNILIIFSLLFINEKLFSQNPNNFNIDNSKYMNQPLRILLNDLPISNFKYTIVFNTNSTNGDNHFTFYYTDIKTTDSLIFKARKTPKFIRIKVKEIININHEYRQQLRSRSWNEIDTRYFGNLTIIGIEQN
jgi:hypothetical protein